MIYAIRLAVVMAVVSLIAACGGDDPEPGVLVDGERLAVVDMHLHTGLWEDMPPGFHSRLRNSVPTGLKWSMPLMSDFMLSSSSILGQLDGAGISAAGIFAVYSPHTTGIATNELVSEFCGNNPQRLYAFGSIRMDQWNANGDEWLEKFESDLANLPHMIGVKLAHAHQQIRFDDERFDGIYEVAGRLGKPIYLHTSGSPNPGIRIEPPYNDPYYLEKAIQKYPDTIFILGHAGWDSLNKELTYLDGVIDLSMRYDNVYFEPGALGAERADEKVDEFVERVKAGGAIPKMIYGSDGAQFPGYVKRHLEHFVAAMEPADYSDEEMPQVLSGNFSRV
ncbi:MAG: amidohydrolase family protein, partial [Gammaproteobacteria bacterium]|nr:amidohydrolase family protein [Gammaproteobacteria bacterium]